MTQRERDSWKALREEMTWLRRVARRPLTFFPFFWSLLLLLMIPSPLLLMLEMGDVGEH